MTLTKSKFILRGLGFCVRFAKLTIIILRLDLVLQVLKVGFSPFGSFLWKVNIRNFTPAGDLMVFVRVSSKP